MVKGREAEMSLAESGRNNARRESAFANKKKQVEPANMKVYPTKQNIPSGYD